MIFIVYSETTDALIAQRLGESEYSYYFVLKEFRPVLEQLGLVVTVADPAREVDTLYHAARRLGQYAVFLSFTPPHLTKWGLECPTIPVFAWEFDTIPDETWYCEREQDWRYVLDKLGRAITHSRFAVETVQRAMGADFPIASIPAPIFDRFARFYDGQRPGPAELSLNGTVIDSRTVDFDFYRPAPWYDSLYPAEPPMNRDPNLKTALCLDGVVYSSIFNPYDGRKNWMELLGSFCSALREVEDATLVLKFTHKKGAMMMGRALAHLYKHTPFKCRIVLIHGFLAQQDYEGLITASTYSVNAAHGEGQCLPLMESMSAGKPAVAPCHSGMADYLAEDNAFLVRSSKEPTSWPHDPRAAYRTCRQRIEIASLVAAFRESYRVAKTEPERYASMAGAANRAMEEHCGQARTAARLTEFLRLAARAPRRDPRYGYIPPRPDAPWIVSEAP
jgi:glycosyltransferase involved in cell wall biosynthesis